MPPTAWSWTAPDRRTRLRRRASDWDRPVFPHGDLAPLAEGLWWVKSAREGMPLPRNMIVVRLPSRLTGFKGAIFNLLGSGGVLGVPRVVGMRFVEDRERVRAFLEKLAERPWKAIPVSHGDPVTADCAARLREAAARLWAEDAAARNHRTGVFYAGRRLAGFAARYCGGHGCASYS